MRAQENKTCKCDLPRVSLSLTHRPLVQQYYVLRVPEEDPEETESVVKY